MFSPLPSPPSLPAGAPPCSVADHPRLSRLAGALCLLLSAAFIFRSTNNNTGAALAAAAPHDPLSSFVSANGNSAALRAAASPSPAPLRCTLITVFSEHKRTLLDYLGNWHANMPYMGNNAHYNLVIFYVGGDAGARPEDLAALRALAPTWRVTLVPFQYDPAWQTSVFTTPNAGGGPYVNWLLARDMYFNFNDVPALRDADYFMRFDDDIVFSQPSAGDPFLALARAGKRVGWKQWIPDNWGGLQSGMFERAAAYAPSLGAGLSDVWPLVSDEKNRGPDNTHTAWRPYLVAGCVEIYAVDVFRSAAYQDFLAGTRAAELLRESKIWEQEVKTMWMQMSVPADDWLCVACLLPVGHKIIDDRNTQLWFLGEDLCDYNSGLISGNDRGHCDLDPGLRFC
jgi:hypothetical protein